MSTAEVKIGHDTFHRDEKGKWWLVLPGFLDAVKSLGTDALDEIEHLHNVIDQERERARKAEARADMYAEEAARVDE